jgi:hypothetical protein
LAPLAAESAVPLAARLPVAELALRPAARLPVAETVLPVAARLPVAELALRPAARLPAAEWALPQAAESAVPRPAVDSPMAEFQGCHPLGGPAFRASSAVTDSRLRAPAQSGAALEQGAVLEQLVAVPPPQAA